MEQAKAKRSTTRPLRKRTKTKNKGRKTLKKNYEKICKYLKQRISRSKESCESSEMSNNKMHINRQYHDFSEP